MNLEDLTNELIEARKLGDRANWKMGDLAGQIKVSYGEEQLQRCAEMAGVEYGTLLEYRRVATKYQSPDRVEKLGWSFHQLVATRDDRMQLLKRAERERWTLARLREEINVGTDPSSELDRRVEAWLLNIELTESTFALFDGVVGFAAYVQKRRGTRLAAKLGHRLDGITSLIEQFRQALT